MSAAAEPEPTSRRYFVTVHVGGDRNLADLADLNLDLIHGTATATDDTDGGGSGGSIEGLLDLAEVARLVEAGHRVTVEQPDYARARAHETTTPEEWLQGMGE